MYFNIASSLVTLGPGAYSRMRMGCMAFVWKNERARLKAWVHQLSRSVILLMAADSLELLALDPSGRKIGSG